MPALADRTAVVTGASRGIGAAIAARFAAEGARIALAGRDEAALAEVAGRIRAAGGEALPVVADVLDAGALDHLRDRTEAAFGPVDVLVANAGGSPVAPGPVEELTEAAWRASVDGNLTATFLTLRAFLPGMKARGRGSIVTLSSAAARRPDARSPAAYAAAKAGVELLTRDVAAQAGPSGVRANCLAPETILTERTARRIPAGLQEELARQHPIGRLGRPEDVAGAAAYLASDDAGWVTGVILDVAGGAVLA